MVRNTGRRLLFLCLHCFTHQLPLEVLQFVVPEFYLLGSGSFNGLLRNSASSIVFLTSHLESSLVLLLKKHDLHLIVLELLAARITQTTTVMVVGISGQL